MNLFDLMELAVFFYFVGVKPDLQGRGIGAREPQSVRFLFTLRVKRYRFGLRL
jgi:hypothetical protein